MGDEKVENIGDLKMSVWDVGLEESVVVNDGSLVCVFWERFSGNKEVKVLVERGDN